MVNGNRRLFPIILLLMASITLLVSSTYAWFSQNKVVDIEGVSVRVSAVKALEISADAVDFKKSITLEDISNASYVVPRFNSLPNTFQPVSTVGNINNGFMDMYYGIVVKDRTSVNYGKKVLTSYKETDVDGTNGKYLVYDLYFNILNASTIYLSKRSEVNYVAAPGTKSGIENALRVAFVYEGTKDHTESLANKQSLNEGSDILIWEPNADKHTTDGITAAKDNYGLIINETNATLPYLGVKSEIASSVLINDTSDTYFGEVTNLVSTASDWKTSDERNLKLFDMRRGITKVRIYAWVEGQDVDCENMASGSSFDFNLIFTTNPGGEE